MGHSCKTGNRITVQSLIGQRKVGMANLSDDIITQSSSNTMYRAAKRGFSLIVRKKQNQCQPM